MKNVKVDIHEKLMKRYKKVPQWWFLVLFIVSVPLSLLTAFIWKDVVQLPWWGMLFGFALSFIITLPIGVILATTNQVCSFLSSRWFFHLHLVLVRGCTTIYLQNNIMHRDVCMSKLILHHI